MLTNEQRKRLEEAGFKAESGGKWTGLGTWGLSSHTLIAHLDAIDAAVKQAGAHERARHQVETETIRASLFQAREDLAVSRNNRYVEKNLRVHEEERNRKLREALREIADNFRGHAAEDMRAALRAVLEEAL